MEAPTCFYKYAIFVLAERSSGADFGTYSEVNCLGGKEGERAFGRQVN
jgi:hypothetical protein